MTAIRTMAILGFCAALAGCAGSHEVRATDPASITLAQARKGIEEGYRRKRAAYLAEDLRAAMAYRTEDFVSVFPDGERMDRAATESYIAEFMSQVVRWIKIEYTIDSLTLDSREGRLEADALVGQHMIRMSQRDDKTVHHVEAWDTQRERWRWAPDGWKLSRVERIGRSKVLVDGRVERTITLAEARKGIEEGYHRNREAFLAKDVKAVMALRTADFRATSPDGRTLDRIAMENYTVGLLNGIDRWIEIDFAIDSLSLEYQYGRLSADVIMRQHLVRMALRPDQKMHHVETWATQNERWRWSPDGWRLAKVDNVRDQKRLVDGKPE